MTQVQRSLRSAALLLSMSWLLLGCSSGIISGTVPNAAYARPEHCAVLGPCRCRDRGLILLAPPKQSHVVVGLIEVRTTRPKAVDVLLEELSDEGQMLCADVIPSARSKDAVVAAGAGPYRPFYVHDDGRTQVLEAQAIQYR